MTEHDDGNVVGERGRQRFRPEARDPQERVRFAIGEQRLRSIAIRIVIERRRHRHMRAQRKAGQPRHGLIDGERAVVAGQGETARPRRAIHGLDDAVQRFDQQRRVRLRQRGRLVDEHRVARGRDTVGECGQRALIDGASFEMRGPEREDIEGIGVGEDRIDARVRQRVRSRIDRTRDEAQLKPPGRCRPARARKSADSAATARSRIRSQDRHASAPRRAS